MSNLSVGVDSCRLMVREEFLIFGNPVSRDVSLHGYSVGNAETMHHSIIQRLLEYINHWASHTYKRHFIYGSVSIDYEY